MNIGGAPNVVFNQMKALDKDKFNVYLLTLYKSKQNNFFEQIDFLDTGKIKQFNLRNRSLFDLKTVYSIFKFLRKNKFNVVYTHLFLTNLIVRSLAFLSGVKTIISFEHSIYYDKKRWQITVDWLLSQITDKIIVSNQEIVDFTSKQEGINETKFAVIPNPIYLPDRNKVDITLLKQSFNVPNNKFIILNIGRFSEEKGQKIILKTASSIERDDILFVLVGHGAMLNDLRGTIEKNNIQNVLLIKEPKRAKEFFYIANLFVLPSLREGQSIVTGEAMMARLPVIASRLPTIEGLIRDGVEGLLFEPGNSEDLKNKILNIYQEKYSLNKLSQGGYDKIKSLGLTIEHNIKTFQDLILNLTKRK
jgi:glycosyltransferase involved in cell wall biosynthesis